MSEYISKARTNSFIVKDVEAFKNDLLAYGVRPEPWSEARNGAEFIFDHTTGSENPAGTVSLFAFGGWPSLDEEHVADRLGLDDDDVVTLKHNDLVQLVASHLVEGQVAVFVEVGAQKMIYLGGTAVAVNASGETRVVDLDNINALAQELTGPETVVTRAVE